MHKIIRISIIGFLLFLSGLFIYLHFNEKDEVNKVQENYHKFRIKEHKYKLFKCKAGRHYTFKTDGDYLYLVIKDKKYEVETLTNICFDEDITIGVGCEANKGLIGKAGYVEVFEDSKGGKELLYLDTQKYSRELASIDKGYTEDVKFQEEPFLMGLFKDNKLVEEIIIGAGKITKYRSWDKQTVRFKAGDFPMLVEIKDLQRFYKEKTFLINPDCNYGNWYKTDIGDAYYLEPGELVKTPIYVVREEKVSMRNKDVKNLKIRIGEQGQWKQSTTDFICLRPEYPGYLYILALRRLVIDEIECGRPERILEMHQGQVEKIAVQSGDVVWTKSPSNYYVNNKLQEKDEDIFHKITKDSVLEIKPGIVGNKIYIYVKFMRRRGY